MVRVNGDNTAGTITPVFTFRISTLRARTPQLFLHGSLHVTLFSSLCVSLCVSLHDFPIIYISYIF